MKTIKIMDHITSIVLVGISLFGSLWISLILFFIVGLILEIILTNGFKIVPGTVSYRKITLYNYSVCLGLTIGLIQGYLIVRYNLISLYFFIISLGFLYNLRKYFQRSQLEFIIYDVCQSDLGQLKRFIFFDRCCSIISYLFSIFLVSYYLKN
jgi:hypothetical protein